MYSGPSGTPVPTNIPECLIVNNHLALQNWYDKREFMRMQNEECIMQNENSVKPFRRRTNEQDRSRKKSDQSTQDEFVKIAGNLA